MSEVSIGSEEGMVLRVSLISFSPFLDVFMKQLYFYLAIPLSEQQHGWYEGSVVLKCLFVCVCLCLAEWRRWWKVFYMSKYKPPQRPLHFKHHNYRTR